jgi:hypothetical protein
MVNRNSVLPLPDPDLVQYRHEPPSPVPLLVFLAVAVACVFLGTWLSRGEGAALVPPGTTVPVTVTTTDSLGAAVAATGNVTWKLYPVPPGGAAADSGTMSAWPNQAGVYLAQVTVAAADTGAWTVIASWTADGIADRRVVATWLVEPPSGPWALSLLVADVADTSAEPFADVTLRNLAGTRTLGAASASGDGVWATVTPGGSIVALATAYGFSVVPETLTVAGAVTDTLWATSWLSDLPAAIDSTTIVVARLRSVSGTPLAGVVVQAQLVGASTWPASGLGWLYSRGIFSDTTDTNGQAELRLVPNSLISPAGTKYEWLLQTSPIERFRRTVPDTTLIFLEDLSP